MPVLALSGLLKFRTNMAALLWISLSAAISSGQTASFPPLLETGTVMISGQSVPYRIRNLPISSFPDLPPLVVQELTTRGCVIPQTYEAHHPENVVHASLEKAGSEDWAVLCNSQGKIALLVFFASEFSKPLVLKEMNETVRLQVHGSGGELGFNWGIDPASPKRIHEAQAGMSHHPVPPDHDCLADSTVDHQTVFHLYKNGAWETVDVD